MRVLMIIVLRNILNKMNCNDLKVMLD